MIFIKIARVVFKKTSKYRFTGLQNLTEIIEYEKSSNTFQEGRFEKCLLQMNTFFIINNSIKTLYIHNKIIFLGAIYLGE